MFEANQIQGHPTPTIFEKIRRGELRFFARLSSGAALASASLHDVVVSVAPVSLAIRSAATLTGATLRDVIFSLSFSGDKIRSAASLVSASLVDVARDISSLNREIRSSVALTDAKLKTVVFDMPPGTSERKTTYHVSLVSAVIA